MKITWSLNAFCASDWVRSMASSSSLGSNTIRMPRPPPPLRALRIIG